MQIRCLIQAYHLVSKLYYGCLAARDEHLLAYFHLFGQTNNVPIDAFSNFHAYSGQCHLIMDLFHEHIRNIDKTYRVVESDSSNSKRIATVKDGAFDLPCSADVMILCQLADHFRVKLLVYFVDMRDSSRHVYILQDGHYGAYAVHMHTHTL